MNRKGRVKIQVSKPALPPFLQRMKDEMILNETSIEDKSRKLPKADKRHFEDRADEGPTVVKLKGGDLDETEYKRIKKEEESSKRSSRDDRSDLKQSGSKDIDHKPKSEGIKYYGKAQRREQELKAKLETQLKNTDQDRSRENKKVNKYLLSFQED